MEIAHLAKPAGSDRQGMWETGGENFREKEQEIQQPKDGRPLEMLGCLRMELSTQGKLLYLEDGKQRRDMICELFVTNSLASR